MLTKFLLLPLQAKNILLIRLPPQSERRQTVLNSPSISDYSESAGHGTSAVYNGKTIQCGGSKILSDEQKKIANKDDSVFVIYDGQLIGSLNVSDTVRPEAKEVISQLKALGVKNTVMLTGDRQQPAENVK